MNRYPDRRWEADTSFDESAGALRRRRNEGLFDSTTDEISSSGALIMTLVGIILILFLVKDAYQV